MIKAIGIDPGQQGAIVLVEIKTAPRLTVYLHRVYTRDKGDVGINYDHVREAVAWQPGLVVVERQQPRGAKEPMWGGKVSVMKEASEYVGAFRVHGLAVVEMLPNEAKKALGIGQKTVFKDGAVAWAKRLLSEEEFRGFALGARGGQKDGNTDALAYAVAGALSVQKWGERFEAAGRVITSLATNTQALESPTESTQP